MRWRANPPPKPKHNEKRVRLVFAWKPKLVGGDIVWLESYEVHETWFEPRSGPPGWWSLDATKLHNPCYY